MTSLHRALHPLYLRAQFLARDVLGVAFVGKLRFMIAHHRWPQVQNASTFSEKVFARKFRAVDARFATCSDKVAVREWVARRVGAQHLIPAVAVYDYRELDALVIAPGQVIKCANRAGGVYFTSIDDCSDHTQLIARLRSKLDFDFAKWTGERWYSQIPKRVIVEEFLPNRHGGVPEDYKFWVFHGVVQLIQVHLNRFSGRRVANFDRDWQPMPVSIGKAIPEQWPEKPATLARMVEIAEALGKEFDFVRVDLYAADDERVYFGEMTFAPASGLSRFEPRDYDKIVGDFWQQVDARR